MSRRRVQPRDASFRDRRRELDKERDAIDLAALLHATDFARTYLLAQADEAEYFDMSLGWPRVHRERANSESYCRTLCFWWVALRLKKEADDAANLSPTERAVIDEEHRRSSAALSAFAEALVAGWRPGAR